MWVAHLFLLFPVDCGISTLKIQGASSNSKGSASLPLPKVLAETQLVHTFLQAQSQNHFSVLVLSPGRCDERIPLNIRNASPLPEGLV